MGHALGLSVSTDPPSRAHSPQACHTPSPLPGPCCRARLFLLIHALELWGRGLELGTKFRHGGEGRQPGIHTRCTRNVQAECLAFKSPGEAAQPPCPTSLPSSLWSPVLSSQSQEPLLTFFQTLDLLPSSLFPRCKPPKTLLPAELPGTKSVGLIPELAFLDLRYNFSPNTWVTGEVCPGSQVLPSQC